MALSTMCSQSASNKSKAIIDDVYAKIQEGQITFDSLVKLYSDDKSTASVGGVLKNQKVNTVPANYIEEASKLKGFLIIILQLSVQKSTKLQCNQ